MKYKRLLFPVLLALPIALGSLLGGACGGDSDSAKTPFTGSTGTGTGGGGGFGGAGAGGDLLGDAGVNDVIAVQISPQNLVVDVLRGVIPAAVHPHRHHRGRANIQFHGRVVL